LAQKRIHFGAKKNGLLWRKKRVTLAQKKGLLWRKPFLFLTENQLLSGLKIVL